jgi:hypothetical protein
VTTAVAQRPSYPDHDFHEKSLTPSGLMVLRPEANTLRSGEMLVFVKSDVPSSAGQHFCELLAFLWLRRDRLFATKLGHIVQICADVRPTPKTQFLMAYLQVALGLHLVAIATYEPGGSKKVRGKRCRASRAYTLLWLAFPDEACRTWWSGASPV